VTNFFEIVLAVMTGIVADRVISRLVGQKGETK
jgi:hypothetical protein